MKIISGQRRGLKLFSPKGDNTRPTESRIKESVFNILGNVRDSVVLDLFAGSGNIGLEFLSRGAESVYLVDNNKDSISIIKKNIEKLNLPGAYPIFGDYSKIIKDLSSKNLVFSHVYIDPPYKMDEFYEKSLSLISNYDYFKNSLIILEKESSINTININLFEVVDLRNYRDTEIIFLRRKF